MELLLSHKSRITNVINDLASGLDGISLAELPKNNQMDRFDKKYIFQAGLIPELLEKAAKQYVILESNETRIFRYTSDYYDTPGFAMYTHHHNGKKNRYKIRVREYLDSGDKFLELKHKNNRSFTRKKRIAYFDDFPLSTAEGHNFIRKNTNVDPADLQYALTTQYQRITLVNKHKAERITIDFDLHLNNLTKRVKLLNLAIAEIKNNDRHFRSHFNQLLKLHRIKQESFSKYCMGIALLNNDVKNNLFKEKIQKIKKIEHEPIVNIS
ncbi:polyphosphate polymerase domain-containing protein [Gaoshiqia sediminis]|uniref:Polyphosphate polymerase domain-containing protein n=1 Tax=Gaoshiqia sediminis TaxID=2986998 RepID=A0AA42CAM8_9BACT|nr:polyphosphate polymerase domain-containing protein [Gaoshiqia sediminis]MCW0483755.1 polyphosphate polymerase domain-containing protein [Gaoshiqia sediminis]